MNKELKPCPFCGGEAITYSDRLDYEGNLLYGVMCKNTGCCTIPAVYMAKEIAIQKWNTRKLTDEIVEQLEELKNTCRDSLEIRALEETIEIVKGGSKHDDYIECQGCPLFHEGECALGILKGGVE